MITYFYLLFCIIFMIIGVALTLLLSNCSCSFLYQEHVSLILNIKNFRSSRNFLKFNIVFMLHIIVMSKWAQILHLVFYNTLKQMYCLPVTRKTARNFFSPCGHFRNGLVHLISRWSMFCLLLLYALGAKKGRKSSAQSALILLSINI